MQEKQAVYCSSDGPDSFNRSGNDVFETALCFRCNDCTDPEYSVLSAFLSCDSGTTGETGGDF